MIRGVVLVDILRTDAYAFSVCPMSRTWVAVLLLAVLTACGSSGSDDQDAGAATESVSPTPSPSESATPTASPSTTTATATPTPTPSKTPKPKPTKPPTLDEQWNLDPGYPKVVAVSTLPDQVRNWYQMSATSERAVAVHPGVWAEFPPGATVEDVIMAGVFDGFCASKKAFERKYLDGEETGGTCW